MSSPIPPREPGSSSDPGRARQIVTPEFPDPDSRDPRQTFRQRERWYRLRRVLPGSDDWTLVGLVVGVIAVALVALALFLPPIKLWDRIDTYLNDDPEQASTAVLLPEGGVPFTALTTASPSLFADGLTLDAAPEALKAPFSVRVVSVSAEDYLVGRVPDEGWYCGIDLPAGYALAGQVYSLTQDGTPPARLRAQVAPRAHVGLTAGTVALFSWDAQLNAWVLLPATLTEQGTLLAETDYVPRCVAAFRVPESARSIGVTQDITEEFDPAVVSSGERLLPGRALPLPDGTLSIILAPEFAAGEGYDVLPVVQNFDDPTVIDSATVERLITNAALRSEHARQITAFVLTDAGYSGAALDYRAVPEALRDDFSAFVSELAGLLHGQGRTLTVILPAPQEGDTAGYDWAALGAAADVVVLQMPLDPRQYAAGASGDALVSWAISQVGSRKLWLGVDARSVEAQPGDLFAPIALAEALGYLGRVTLDESSPDAAAPGDILTARLGHPAGVQASFAFDRGLSIPQIHYQSGSSETLRTMWLTTPLALYQRLAWAARQNLGGVLVFHLLDAGVVPGVRSALLAYRLDQPAVLENFTLAMEWIVRSGDSVLALESGQPDRPFSFTVPDNLPEGLTEFTLEAQLNGVSLGSQTIPLANAAVVAATVTPTSEPDPEPSEEPTQEPTVESTVEPTAEPSLTASAKPTQEPTSTPTAEPTLAATPTSPLVEALPGAPTEASSPVAISQPPTFTPAPLPDVIPTFAAPPPDTSTLDSLVVPTVDPALLAGVDLGSTFEAGAALLSADREMLKVGKMKLSWLRLDAVFTMGATVDGWGETITIAQANGFKVLVSVSGWPGDLAATTHWAAYATDYARFTGELAALGVDAIEVWPGANTFAGWPSGVIDPARYAKLLGLAYHAIKTARPATLVVSGAPTPLERTDSGQTSDAWDDDAFYAGLAAVGGASMLDCVGVEYLGGLAAPTETSGDPRGVEAIYYLPAQTARAWDAFGGARPICFTRLGYPSPVGYTYLPEHLNWAQGISPEQAGQALAGALGTLRSDPRVRLALVWLVEPPSLDTPIERGPYSLLRPDGSCPACDLIAAIFTP